MKAPAERWVKICGVTNVADAVVAVAEGASALGLNFVPSSRRYIDPRSAREIARAVAGRAELVGVFADEPVEKMETLRTELGLDWLQLHGAEPPELVARLPRSFKALGVVSPEDVERALSYPGERVLLDAKVGSALGGTGVTFDWSLVSTGPHAARLIVAGGLHPGNVGDAIARMSPFGVDVASGVEPPNDPRRKDADKIRAFVRAARGG